MNTPLRILLAFMLIVGVTLVFYPLISTFDYYIQMALLIGFLVLLAILLQSAWQNR